MSDLTEPGHDNLRSFLRILGPAIAAVGLVFMIIGVGSFFAALGSFEPPRYFWCAFVGMPLLAVGSVVSKFAYMGAVARYIASEAAPVAKDAANYMVAETKDSIRDVAAAISEGSAATTLPNALRCQKCGTENEASANYCRVCGTPLAKMKCCGQCGASNDTDARFCEHCGAALE